MNAKTFGALAFVLGLVPGAGASQKFYADDPLHTEFQIDTPAEPKAIELSDLYDRLAHTFHDFGDGEGESLNVNTVDEVPNSPWFTGRHGVRRMSIAELVRGPNQSDGPDMTSAWTVSNGKSQGLTPGFEIIDGQGERYVIKLDPVGVPELSSSAEVIASKLFHAIGYNVPENTIVRFDPDQLVVDPDALAEDRFGDSVPLTPVRLTRMLRHVPRLADGKIRAVASKYVPGTPLGPFRYHGTRSDDPNDVVPHEHRRELRGLRLFAAWLNHDDSRSHNTHDTWIGERDKRYVKHYLIDFGSSFGSGTVDLQLPNLSFHHWFEPALIKKNALGFGFHVPLYRKVEWPKFPEYRSVGRWESSAFEPEGWKGDYPNPAFSRMTARDAFWAAKILMRFTPKELEAIVATGEYGNPEEERYFYETLLVRQRKSGAFGLLGTNPVDAFQVSENQLEFENLAEAYELAPPETSYTISWFVYDDADGSVEGIASPLSTRTTAVELPAYGQTVRTASLVPSGAPKRGAREFLLAEIRSHHPDYPKWETPVRVYLRFVGESYDVVGIERSSVQMTKVE